MIKGLIKTSLDIIKMDAGNVMHALKNNEKSYKTFGEAYFSMIKPGAVKGWKKHNLMICNFVVPVGKVKVVIYDKPENRFEEILLSTENYFRLTIPPKLWVAFQGIDTKPSLLLNIASIRHDPAEAENIDLKMIEYNWGN